MFHELFPKVRSETSISVGDNREGKTVKTVNVVEEKFGDFFSVGVGCGWNEVDHRGEAVDDHEDGVESIRSRKRSDEVHGNVRPRAVGYGERVQESVRTLGRVLVALTFVAGLNVSVDVLSECGPVELLFRVGPTLAGSKMSKSVVNVLNDEFAEVDSVLGDLGNDQLVWMVGSKGVFGVQKTVDDFEVSARILVSTGEDGVKLESFDDGWSPSLKVASDPFGGCRGEVVLGIG